MRPRLATAIAGHVAKWLGQNKGRLPAELAGHEWAALVDGVENRGTRGASPEGAPFLMLLAHAFDVRFSVVEDGGASELGPRSATHVVELFRGTRGRAEGGEHYSGSSAPPRELPGNAPEAPEQPPGAPEQPPGAPEQPPSAPEQQPSAEELKWLIALQSL